MTLHNQILQQLQSQLATPQADQVAQLNNALRLLAKWRSVLIQNTVLQQQGTVVMQGPLQGMDFLPQSAEGCHIAQLLGCYPALPNYSSNDLAQRTTLLSLKTMANAK